MADVICDTDFLIRLATTRIKNISRLDVEIGSVRFVVPRVVLAELERLSADPAKARVAAAAAAYAAGLRVVDVGGSFADKGILDHVKRNGGTVATMDRELKGRVRSAGGGVISLSGDRVVLEPS